MRQLQKKIKTGRLDLKEDDPFELFVAATNIRYCYYNETHKILGNTYGMCVLQVCVLYFINHIGIPYHGYIDSQTVLKICSTCISRARQAHGFWSQGQ